MNRLVSQWSVVLTLVAFFFTSALVPAVDAAVIDTPDYLSSKAAVSKTDLQGMLMREDVREQLLALGVDPEDASNRIASLTDAELRQIQQSIDELPAGSSALAILGAVLLVLIILELLGVTNVFTRL